jgi:monofunctional biosynthetic peptidoglycan transglycosylase
MRNKHIKQIVMTAMMVLLSVVLFGCVNNQAVLFPTTDFEAETTKTETIASEAELTLTQTSTSTDSTGSIMTTPTPDASTLLPGREIFAFGDNEPLWYTVDDNVMGGVSSSTVNIIEKGILSFSGTMSLDNNGGFSSVRSDWTPTDLSDADGVLLRVLGDGKVYRLRIRSAVTGPEISFNAVFETAPETWKVVYVPFSIMVPTYRGFIMDVEALDPSSIGSFGFMLSDKQPGEFRLLVDWIRAVSEEELETYNAN